MKHLTPFRKMLTLSVLGLILAISTQAQATNLFIEDFESGLSQWEAAQTGFGGQIVKDPLGTGRGNVLNFNRLFGSGDIKTVDAFTSTTGFFTVNFDYLGLDSGPGVDGDLGGFIWNSIDYWRGTGGGYPDELPDTGLWERVSFTVSGSSIWLMLEDWAGSGGIAGDAYFDNFLITDLDHATASPANDSVVPAPASAVLLALGLVLLRKGRGVQG